MGKAKKAGASSSSASKDDMIDIDPECIRFTHARIRPFFTGCGYRIEETLADIIGGKMSVNDLPKITVILNEGTYFSLNNRRLYVLKELRSKGLLKGNTIGARVKVALEREKERYKIDRCSLVAKIMKENAAENKDQADDDGEDNDCESEKEDGHDELIDTITEKVKDLCTKENVKDFSLKEKVKDISSKEKVKDIGTKEKTKDVVKKKKGSSKRRADSDDDF